MWHHDQHGGNSITVISYRASLTGGYMATIERF